MNITPSDNWFWYYDDKLDRAMLDLANGMVFCSRYSGKQLIQDALHVNPFTVEEASLFYILSERAVLLMLSEDKTLELILNALFAKFYLKPLMPKSWYFDNQWCHLDCQLGDIVQVKLVDEESYLTLFVIDSGGIASLCLVAQPGVKLVDRTLHFCDTIKIMNDRLLPFQRPRREHESYSYKIS